MQNRTQNHDSSTRPVRAIDTTRRQCLDRTWCTLTGSHVDHVGEPDLPIITATAHREDFVSGEQGVIVPEVYVQLVEVGPSNACDRHSIHLGIVPPDGESATAHLTLREAGLLAKALTELLGDAADAEDGVRS